MKKRLLFVVNFHSGQGQIKGRLAEVIDKMVKAGYEVIVHPTQSRGDATRIVAEKAAEIDRIVVSGGDGTLNEAVQGLSQAGVRVPVGYLPAGSTNDFGTSLGIPKDLMAATDMALGDKIFTCDMGLFNDRSFVYVAAFGTFAEVSYETPQEAKNVLGHNAYILEGLRQLRNLTSYRATVTCIGETYEGDFLCALVTYTKSVGGFSGIIPGHIDLCDGLLEVTLVRNPRNVLEFNEIVGFLTGLVEQTDNVICLQSDRVEFCTETAVPWTLDGEFGGTWAKVNIRNNPGCADLVVG